MAFRSIVISATAAITTILSAFVGFGVLTLVVQEGHLLSLMGLDCTGPIETVRTADRLHDPVRPVDGLHGVPHEPIRRSTSTAWPPGAGGRARHRGDRARDHRRAALIMGTVFAAFILNSDRIPEGVRAPARGRDPHRRAARAHDASVPALLTLLGEKSWHIPRWLDKFLPNITIESPHEGGPVPEPAVPRPEPRGRDREPALEHTRRESGAGTQPARRPSRLCDAAVAGVTPSRHDRPA